MKGVDWDKGLPLDVLSAVAGGHDELKAMRGVCHTWKAGFESSVTKIQLSRNGPMLPSGGTFATRFPAARSVDLSESLLASKRASESLTRLAGAQITCLGLRGSQYLTDSGLTLLRELPLTSLALSGCNQITNAGLGSLRGLPIKDLDLANCQQLTPAGLAQLRGMSLRRLIFMDTSPRRLDAPPEALAPLISMQLTDLGLSGWGVTDEGLAVLRGHPLTRLNLRCCHMVTDAGLSHLSGLLLEDLNLDAEHGLPSPGRTSRMTPAGLAHLRGMPLQRLSLSAWDFRGLESPSGALAPLAAMPLTDLNLKWSTISDAGLALLRGLPLTRLNLAGCNNLTPAGLEALKGLRLRALSLGMCREPPYNWVGFLLDYALPHLRGMPLTELTLRSTTGNEFSDLGLKHLRGLPLTRLDLSGLIYIRGSGFKAFEGAPLTNLDLGGCLSVSDAGMRALRDLPIKKLRLSGSPLDPETTLGSLRGLPITDLALENAKWVSDAGLRALTVLPLTKLHLRLCSGLSGARLALTLGVSGASACGPSKSLK